MTLTSASRRGAAGAVNTIPQTNIQAARGRRVATRRLTALAQQLTKEHHSTNGSTSTTLYTTPANLSEVPEERVNSAAEVPQAEKSSRINVIDKSRWPEGIPAVMGAHLMASGTVAPLSTSKGPGQGVEHLFYYPTEDQERCVVNQYVNGEAGAKGLSEIVKEISDASIKARGYFTLVLSGGSLLKALAELVDNKGVDFSKWHVAYADERNVPHSSDDSNHKGAKDVFLSKVDIPASQIYAIKEGLSVDEASKEYEGQLLRIPQSVLPRNSEGWPIFDLVLLGIGPDGHVASLFPNHKQVAFKDGWVLPVSDSPKPPPERISLSLPVINSAANVGIVAFGEGKAEIIQRALEVQCLPGALPAQLVRPKEGTLRWLLDCGAASRLNINKWNNTKDFPRSQ